jgi:hypothetical protein
MDGQDAKQYENCVIPNNMESRSVKMGRSFITIITGVSNLKERKREKRKTRKPIYEFELNLVQEF